MPDPSIDRQLSDLLKNFNAPGNRPDIPTHPFYTPKGVSFAREQLARFTYKPGWEFSITGGRGRDLWEPSRECLVVAFETEDTYNPGRTIKVGGGRLLYHMGNEDMFGRQLASFTQELEIHESREWLRRDGEIFDDPHANDPR